jgi:RimJ/RimL family protein N-acetyltransferase
MKALTSLIIRTERLELVPLSTSLAQSLFHGRGPRRSAWAADYPTDASLVAAGMTLTAVAKGLRPAPYGAYQIVRREDELVIGDCGYLGPPDAAGVVYAGVDVVDSERGEGYATEALEGLIGFAFTDDEVDCVRTEAEKRNGAARRVAEKAGMACVAEDAELVYFEA